MMYDTDICLLVCLNIFISGTVVSLYVSFIIIFTCKMELLYKTVHYSKVSEWVSSIYFSYFSTKTYVVGTH